MSNKNLFAWAMPRVVAATVLTLAAWSTAAPQIASAYLTTTSADGVPIAYQVHGHGEQTLVFVHGWSCDRTYWHFQRDAFSQDYRVVTLDLAGHGDSGAGRSAWSIANFARDVAAVIDAVDARNVIVIGHSLGGPIVLEAALLRPGRVVGVIGVDASTLSDGAAAQGLAPLIERMRTNYGVEARAFAQGMFRPTSPPELAGEVVNAMVKTPPEVGIPVLEGLRVWGKDRQADAMAALAVPVALIVAGSRPAPTQLQNSRAPLVGVERIPDVGHFLMMEDPHAFNAALQRLLKGFRNTDAQVRAIPRL